MAEDIASLVIRIDAASAAGAMGALDGLTGAAGRAEKAVGSMSGALGRVEAATEEMAGALDRGGKAAEDLAGDLAKAEKATEELEAAASKHASTSKTQDAAVRSQASGLGAAAIGMGNFVKSAEGGSGVVGKFADQFTKMAFDIASGQKAMDVFAQGGLGILQTMAETGAGLGPVFEGLLGSFAGFAPVLAPLGAIFGGLAIGTYEINKATGDLSKSMGLSADEIKRAKDQHISLKVTMGDTAQAMIQVVGGGLLNAFKAPLAALKGVFDTVLNTILNVVKVVVSAMIAYYVGGFNAIRDVWKMLPPALGDAAISAANFALRAVEAMINGAIGLINGVISKANDAAKLVGVKLSIPLFQEVKLPELANPYAGAMAKAGNLLNVVKDDFVDAFHNVESFFDNFGKLVTNAAVEIRKDKIDTGLNRGEQGSGTGAKAGGSGGYAGGSGMSGCDCNSNMAAGGTVKGALEIVAPEQIKLLDQHVDLLKQDVTLISEMPGAITNLADAQNGYNDSLAATAAAMAKVQAEFKVMGGLASTFFGQKGQAVVDLLSATKSYADQEEKIRAKEKEDLANITVAQDASDTDRAKASKDRTDTEKKADADVLDSALKRDASILGSVKTLFGEQSGIYKALSVIQQLSYAEKFALQAKDMAMDAVNTAKMLANSLLRQSANGAEAISKSMTAWPFPLNLLAAAATAAALISFGVKVFGGGGGGAAAAPKAEDLQKAAGTGTVLGSVNDKSDSIAKSLDLLSKNSNSDLEYSDKMLVALRSIDQNISGLTAAIARSLDVSSGVFDTASLALGTTKSALAAIPIIGALFGATKTTTLLDQGLRIDPQSIHQLTEGVAGAVYQTVETQSKTKFLGFTVGSSDKVKDVAASLPDDLSQQVGLVVQSLEDGVLAAAATLGVTGAKATLDAFQVDIGKISFKDLDAQGIQDELNAVFGKLGDQMAQAIVPSISQFQQAGEGAMQTLVRLAKEYQTVDVALQQLGMSFDAVGLGSIAARDHLVQLFGGLDNFTSATGEFAKDFLSEAQQLAPVQAAVAKAMADLGESGIATKAQFVALVQGLDLSTDAGAQLYSQLLAIAPAFAKVTEAADQLASQRQDLEIQLLQAQGDALAVTALQRQKELAALDASLRPLQQVVYAAQDLAAANDNLAQAQTNLATLQQQAMDAATQAQIKALQDIATAAQKTAQDAASAAQDAASKMQSATQALTDAYNTQAGALNDAIKQFSGFVDSLQAFRQSLDLGKDGGLSVGAQYALARGQFAATAAAAKAGDATALGKLQDVSQAFLSASQAASPSALGYQRDVSAVKAALDAAMGGAQHQAGKAQQQLDALNKQVTGLIDVNKSVLSVKDAVTALHTAMAQAAAAQAAADAAQTAYLDANAKAQSAQAAQAANQAAQQAAKLAQDLAAAQAAVTMAQQAAGSAGGGSSTSTSGLSRWEQAKQGLLAGDPAAIDAYIKANPDVVARYNHPTGNPNEFNPLPGETLQQFADRHAIAGITSGAAGPNNVGRNLFATGAAFTGQGVYRRPTMFGMGELGERGPEGVLPLANIGGRLGVYAQNDNGAAAEVRALRTVIERLEARLASIERSTETTAKATNNMNRFGVYAHGAGPGDPVETEAA